jgi:alginate O-acetyltransferase complex protein AlgI
MVRLFANWRYHPFNGCLWHGAAWNFVIWGAIHGRMLVLERIRGKHAF